MFKTGSIYNTSDTRLKKFKKKTSSKKNLNNESKLKRRSQGTISQLAILRVQNNWGAKEGEKFKAIRCSTRILNVGFPDGDLT